MSRPSHKIGEMLHSLGYQILGGDTIFPSAEKIDIIGVLERHERHRHSMDLPDTFYGRRIALIRAHGDPIVVEYFRKDDEPKIDAIKRGLEGVGFRVRVDFVRKNKDQNQLRFK